MSGRMSCYRSGGLVVWRAEWEGLKAKPVKEVLLGEIYSYMLY